MTEREISRILQCHRMWLEQIEGGARADLTGSDLRGVDLSVTDLREATRSELTEAPQDTLFMTWYAYEATGQKIR